MTEEVTPRRSRRLQLKMAPTPEKTCKPSQLSFIDKWTQTPSCAHFSSGTQTPRKKSRADEQKTTRLSTPILSSKTYNEIFVTPSKNHYRNEMADLRRKRTISWSMTSDMNRIKDEKLVRSEGRPSSRSRLPVLNSPRQCSMMQSALIKDGIAQRMRAKHVPTTPNSQRPKTSLNVSQFLQNSRSGQMLEAALKRSSSVFQNSTPKRVQFK